MSYNPSPSKNLYGRASWEGEKIFYGSISGSDMESYMVSQAECLQFNESNKQIENRQFCFGKWVLQKNLSFVLIGNSTDFKYTTEKILGRNDFVESYFQGDPIQRSYFDLIDNFMSREFSKSVPEDKNYEYKISAMFTHLLFKSNVKHNGKVPGLIYPSVASEGRGLNIALPSSIIDEGFLKLERVASTKFYFRDNRCVNDIVREASVDGKNLRWDQYKDGNDSSIMDYYLGRPDLNPLKS